MSRFPENAAVQNQQVLSQDATVRTEDHLVAPGMMPFQSCPVIITGAQPPTIRLALRPDTSSSQNRLSWARLARACERRSMVCDGGGGLRRAGWWRDRRAFIALCVHYCGASSPPLL
jgi:hypothetical protein